MARLNSAPQPSESPMDFAYDDGHGPVNPDSPFVQNNFGAQPFKSGFAGQKRSSSELESPTRNSVPGLRRPEGQTYLFPTTPSSKAHPAFRAPSFTTPQPSVDTDFTSEGEQSSPVAADSPETPELSSLNMNGKGNGRSVRKFDGGGKSEKKDSPLGRLQRKYTDVLARRVYKRRRREGDGDVRSASRRSSNNKDGDSSDAANSHQNSQQMGIVPSILTFIDAHPSLPNTLSVYVQFLLNVFFAFCLVYILWGIFSTISNDIAERAMQESSEILAEITACSHEFRENRCDRATRVPAMETVCNNWERCMQRDPYKVGRSRLSAGMFAEMFNEFIEPISFKAICVSIAVVVGCFAVNNLTFGFYRAKLQNHPQSHPPPPGPPQHLLSPSAMHQQHSASAPQPSHFYLAQNPQDAAYFSSPYRQQHYQQPYMEGSEKMDQDGRDRSPGKRLLDYR